MANTNLDYRLTLKKDGFSKGLKSATEDTKRLDGAMGKLSGGIKRIGIGIAAAFSVGAIVNFGKSVIDALKNYEYFSASLRTLMYGDRNTAKALEGQLVKLAATTPFSLTDVQAGSRQLLAYGFKPGNVTKDLKMLGDMASGVGAPLTDIVYLYGTLKTQGRAYTRDINQFTNRGIPIIAELAKQFKVTEDKIKDLVTAGNIGFPQIEKAFKSMTSEGGQFFKMMDEQSLTVGGRLSNLGDSWEQLKVNIGKSQTGIINSTVSWVASLVEGINNVIAANNQLEESIKKSGQSQLSFWEKTTPLNILSQNLLGIDLQKTTKSQIMGIQSKFNRGISEATTGDDIKQKEARLNALTKLADLQIGQILSRKGDEKSFREGSLKIAVLEAAKETIKGNLKLLKDEGSKAASDSTGAPLNSSVQEYHGAKALNVNITVNELGKIETLNVNEMNDVNQLHTDWRKHLLELLNDANQIANR
jgi:hypothetical protein